MQDDVRDRSSRPSSAENIAARIQSLRSILSSERHTTAEQQVALEALDREEADRRRTMEREASAASSPIPRPFNDEGYWEPQGGTSPASMVRERRRGFRPTARVERQRDRIARLARSEPLEPTSAPSTRPSNLSTSRVRQASPEIEPLPIQESRYSKRRKLDDGTSDNQPSNPDYSVEGMLRPGELRVLVLDSTDPQAHTLPADEDARLSICTSDNHKIFRSKRRKCSVLMKHRTGWPFNLSKLVVKIPKHDHAAAPLQGLIFVSMTDEKLLEKTAYYDTLMPTSYVMHRKYDSYRPNQAYIHPSRAPLRPFLPERPMTEPANAQWCDMHDPNHPAELAHPSGFDITYEQLPEESDDSPSSPRSPRPWHDQDHEYTRRQYAMRAAADNYRPRYSEISSRRWRPNGTLEPPPERDMSPTPSDSDDEGTPLYRGVPQSHRELEEAEYRQRNILEQMRAQRERRDDYHYFPSSWAGGGRYDRYDDNGEPMTPEHDYRAPTSASRAASPRATIASSSEHLSTKRLPGPNEMLQGRSASSRPDEIDREVMPHARFQVTKESGGIAVKFDPPVSGKYILVKLWTQCPNSSVTVTGVVPYGFGGLRQVPDLSFR